MALINCPKCNALVSDRAKKCPQCGYSFSLDENKAEIESESNFGAIDIEEKHTNSPIKDSETSNKVIAVIIILAVFGLIGLISLDHNNSSPAQEFAPTPTPAPAPTTVLTPAPSPSANDTNNGNNSAISDWLIGTWTVSTPDFGTSTLQLNNDGTGVITDSSGTSEGSWKVTDDNMVFTENNGTQTNYDLDVQNQRIAFGNGYWFSK
jgi:hypothetical protein